MRVALQGVASRDAAAEKNFFPFLFPFLVTAQTTLTSAADSAWAMALVSVSVHFINAQQAN